MIGALPTRSVRNHIKEKTEMFLSFKDSTFMTHIYASYHANKKCTIRKSRVFSSFKDSTLESFKDST